MNSHPQKLDAQTTEVIRSAITMAQAGRLPEACATAERGLADGAQAGPLQALLGMLRCRSGDLEGGVTALRLALREAPDDPAISLNLVTALHDLGRFAEALEVITPARVTADPSGRLARFRPWLLQQDSRFDDAAAAYRDLLEREPGDWQQWNNLGNALTAAGRGDEGLEALEQAVALAPDIAPLRLNLARQLVDLDRLDAAEEVLRAGAAWFGDDEHFPADLADLHDRKGDTEAAITALEEACRRRPDDNELAIRLARKQMDGLQLEAAEKTFRAILAREPAHPQAFVGLAVTYERARPDSLTPLAEEATTAGLAGPQLQLLRAFGVSRGKDHQAVLDNLDGVPDTVEPIHRSQLRGQALDRLGRADEAWTAFQAMNAALAADPSRPLERAALYRAEVARNQAALTPAWLGDWTAPPQAGPERTPVFLVGFPRSGTTLLDTFLMGHPDVEVLEEKRGLAVVDKHLGGFDALPAITADQIEEARTLYFAEAARDVALAPGKLLVDKSPMFLNRVPLIRRLFPDARFLLALRHPADVLLSCYVSNFRLNPAMSNFIDLDTAAELYDLTFSYWSNARELFALDVAEVRYERLVEDVEAELKPVIAWLGLEWRDGLLDHRKTAAERGLITTASYAQVHEPIYRRSAGRWHAYRRHLEPVLPRLRPWAERFGYTID